MSYQPKRLWAIVKADFLIRFRRTSAIVIFLLLCFAAYNFVPAPSSGLTLIAVDKQRVLYNSAAVAAGTGLLCAVLLGLFGFYLVSNSLRRDIRARTRFVVASTSVGNGEYLFGKFLGNVVFLSAISVGFMLNAKAMFLLRGETQLEPFVFIGSYLLLLPPVIVFVSVVALVFETVPFLSGRIGDVVYFFVWSFSLAPAIAAFTTNQPSSITFFDIYGLGLTMQQLVAAFGNNNLGLAVGSVPFDATKPAIYFDGLKIDWFVVLSRFGASLISLPLLAVALFFFHRFDPARIRLSVQRSSQNVFAQLNNLLKPLIATLLSPAAGGDAGAVQDGQTSFVKLVGAEVLLILRLAPITLFLLLGFGVTSIFVALPVLQQGLLPVIFMVLVIVLADISTREKGNGTTTILYALPLIKTNFVAWKFTTTLFLATCFTIVPMLRLLIGDKPSAAISLLIGSAFMAAMATGLGITTTSPKAFIVIFLLFLYLVINDAGRSATLDFAGWYGTATAGVMFGYLALTIVVIVAAKLLLWQQQRNL